MATPTISIYSSVEFRFARSSVISSFHSFSVFSRANELPDRSVRTFSPVVAELRQFLLITGSV